MNVIDSDSEECAAYIVVAASAMNDGEKGGNSKFPTLNVTKFKIINYSSTATEFPHI